jgi:isopentenyl diphosphate isomerase/L-lactate dehydrogenase-like FMN-dependent dehydrogenase
MHKLASPEGENAVARAAFKMGLNMTLYSQSTTPLKMVISARQRYRQDSMAPFWFQIYFTAD